MEKNNMKRRSTFAVLFYINRTKVRKDGLCQLLCKVSIDAEAAQIGTKVAVNPTIWNPTTGRADGRSHNANEVNRAIDALTEEIKAHYKRINLSLGFVTAELVKNAVKGIGQKPLTLLALFREHNEEFRKRVGIDRTKETYESYVRSYNHLRDFVQQRYGQEDITLRSLDREFYDAFDLFLRTERRLQQKSVHEHLYRLKKMTVRAVNQGTLRRDPYTAPRTAQAQEPPPETRRTETPARRAGRRSRTATGEGLVHLLDLYGAGLCRPETIVGETHYTGHRGCAVDTYPTAKDRYGIGRAATGHTSADYREILGRTYRRTAVADLLLPEVAKTYSPLGNCLRNREPDLP